MIIHSNKNEIVTKKLDDKNGKYQSNEWYKIAIEANYK